MGCSLDKQTSQQALEAAKQQVVIECAFLTTALGTKKSLTTQQISDAVYSKILTGSLQIALQNIRKDSLKKIKLLNLAKKDTPLKAIKGINLFVKNKALHLERNQLVCFPLQNPLKRLEILNLNQNKIATMKGLEQLPVIKVLYLEFNCLITFTYSKNLNGLQKLGLYGNKLQLQSCKEIKKQNIPTLKFLSLSFDPSQKIAQKYFQMLKQSKLSLQSLYLRNSQNNPSQIESLKAELKKNAPKISISYTLQATYLLHSRQQSKKLFSQALLFSIQKSLVLQCNQNFEVIRNENGLETQITSKVVPGYITTQDSLRMNDVMQCLISRSHKKYIYLGVCSQKAKAMPFQQFIDSQECQSIYLHDGTYSCGKKCEPTPIKTMLEGMKVKVKTTSTRVEWEIQSQAHDLFQTYSIALTQNIKQQSKYFFIAMREKGDQIKLKHA